jgi:thiamine transporter ThiT
MHSNLARFLTNPGPVHLSEVKYVWQYLYGTMYLAICAQGGEPTQTYTTKVDLYNLSDEMLNTAVIVFIVCVVLSDLLAILSSP